ncbi:MAG TPA: hypothetical protein VM099_09395 [Gemmatimonadaceae bacterium]|nr:hypothetical protein [Gemmatimonadaceae bacterium]
MRLGSFCIGFGVAASFALGCTDIPTDDNAILAISVDTVAAPAVVLGDTLRDTTGKAVPLTASVYNFKGNVVSSAPIQFQAIDRGITVNKTTGFVVGDSLRDTPARIVVSVGGLQAIQQLLVTTRPDTVFAVNGRDSLVYSFTDTTKNVSPALSVRVRHTLTTDSAVKNYLVTFAIVSTSDTTLAKLVNDAGTSSRVDTTDANGEASRKIRLNPAKLSAVNDSVIVMASVKYRGAVRGSPVRLVLKVKSPT